MVYQHMPLLSSTNYIFTSKAPQNLMTICKCKPYHQSLSITECWWWYRKALGWHGWTINYYDSYGAFIVLFCFVFHQDREKTWEHRDSSICSTSFKAQIFGFPPPYSRNWRLFSSGYSTQQLCIALELYNVCVWQLGVLLYVLADNQPAFLTKTLFKHKNF